MIKESKTGRIYVPGKKCSEDIVLGVHYLTAKGHTVQDVVKLLGICTQTVKKILKKKKILEGKLSEKEIYSYVRVLLKEYNDLFLREIVVAVKDFFGDDISESTVSRYLKKMDFTKKKLTKVAYYCNTVKVQLQRREFRMLMHNFPYWLLVNIDESSFKNSDLVRDKGWNEVGDRARNFNHRVSKKGLTLILAISYFGVVHFKLVESKGSGCGGEEFNLFLKELFVKLRRGVGLLIENASIHLTADNMSFYEFMKSNGVFTLNNAPYSPDYAPVELCFNTIKKRIKVNNGALELKSSIISEINRISENGCVGFFENCKKNWNSNKI